MLKIAIDATPIMPGKSGVGFYVSHLINALHLLQSAENFQLSIIYQPRLQSWLKNDFSVPDIVEKCERIQVLPLPVRLTNLSINLSPTLLSYYFERFLHCQQIIHGTNHSVYPCLKAHKVMSIYDLTFIKYPQYTDAVAKSYKQQVKHNLKWTDIIITISENSKKDIVDHLGVEPAKVYVTPLASRYYPEYLSDVTANELAKAINYDFSIPYLLFVSTLEPRKNITNLIAAFNYLRQKYKISHNLILIGQKGWKYKPIFQAIASSPYQDCIHHLNYLSDELVALFYSKADVFVYPSHYEGFGLPVLEAMTLGAPVVTSNTSSLPEVAGDAAILVAPNDVISLAEAILNVISDRGLRTDLIAKGKARASLYSWERTAKETLQAYRSLL